MINKLKASFTEENLILFVYGLWFLVLNVSITYLKKLFDINTVYACVCGVVYALLVWHLMITSENKQTCIKILIFIAVGAIAYYFSSMNYVLPLICMAVCVKDIDYKKLFKLYIVIALIVMIIAVTASSLGVINNRVEEGERIRISLGYTYYSYASHIALFVSLAYIAVRKKITIIEIGLLAAWNYVIYYFTDTKVPFYTAIVIFVLTLVIMGIKRLDKFKIKGQCSFIKYFVILSPFLFLIFSYIIHLLYNSESEIWVKLNQWLNTRLELGHAAILGIPQTIFGQKITWNDWAQPLGFSNYFFVDNSYINIMLQEGIIYMCMILSGFAYVIMRALRGKDWMLILAIFGCMILGLADPELADPRFQPMILLIGWMLGSRDQYSMTGEDSDESISHYTVV